MIAGVLFNNRRHADERNVAVAPSVNRWASTLHWRHQAACRCIRKMPMQNEALEPFGKSRQDSAKLHLSLIFCLFSNATVTNIMPLWQRKFHLMKLWRSLISLRNLCQITFWIAIGIDIEWIPNDVSPDFQFTLSFTHNFSILYIKSWCEEGNRFAVKIFLIKTFVFILNDSVIRLVSFHELRGIYWVRLYLKTLGTVALEDGSDLLSLQLQFLIE